MHKAVKFIVVGLVFTAVSGCSYNTSKYGASFENIETLKNYSGAHVSVEQFTSAKPGQSEITCRVSRSVVTPNKESFESYIHNAFVSELKLAGIYSEQSPIILKGYFSKIDFNSNIGNGKWVFELNASSNKNKQLKITSKHEFSTNWVAGIACQQVAQEFSPAVQYLIRDLITNPKFKELFEADLVTKI